MNPDDRRRMESLSELPEPKKQRTLMMENDPQEFTSIIMEAVAAVVEEGVASSDNYLIDSSVVATTAEPKYDQIPTSSDDKDEKLEFEFKEEKSPATMSADLLPVNFDSSLIYNQSQIEAIVQCHTFIGSSSRSSSKEDSSAMQLQMSSIKETISLDVLIRMAITLLDHLANDAYAVQYIPSETIDRQPMKKWYTLLLYGRTLLSKIKLK